MTDPQMTDRGFAFFEPIRDRSGQTVQVREASTADEPCLWLRFESNPSFDAPGGVDVSAHLTLDQAALLRDQLGVLIDGHYHKNLAR